MFSTTRTFSLHLVDFRAYEHTLPIILNTIAVLNLIIITSKSQLAYDPVPPTQSLC